jgi:hypothetical protein
VAVKTAKFAAHTATEKSVTRTCDVAVKTAMFAAHTATQKSVMRRSYVAVSAAKLQLTQPHKIFSSRFFVWLCELQTLQSSQPQKKP